MKRVLFICLGNICRSPAAEGIFRSVASEASLEVVVDSAGTGAWHIGKSPDTRMMKAAARRDIDIHTLRGRQIELADFYEFDYILCMDLSNLQDVLTMAPANRISEIKLFLDYAQSQEREVPDPYYGGHDGFEHVLDLLEDATKGFLIHLEREND